VRGLKPKLAAISALRNTSHPAWVRGLKQISLLRLPCYRKVAPRVGAWIETSLRSCSYSEYMSHPAWVRGLKPLFTHVFAADIEVAPRVGAWIETCY